MKAIRMTDGTIQVNNVGKDWYYAHGITEIGSPEDAPGNHNSVWGWINHLREKNWWSPSMEREFIEKVKSLL